MPFSVRYFSSDQWKYTISGREAQLGSKLPAAPSKDVSVFLFAFIAKLNFIPFNGLEPYGVIYLFRCGLSWGLHLTDLFGFHGYFCRFYCDIKILLFIISKYDISKTMKRPYTPKQVCFPRKYYVAGSRYFNQTIEKGSRLGLMDRNTSGKVKRNARFGYLLF